MLWLNNASDVQLYGYGGNACPRARYPAGFAQFLPSLFRIQESTNISLVNLISYEMPTTLKQASVPAALEDDTATCLPPDQWLSVVEMSHGLNTSTRYLDRPVLYRRT